MQDPDVNAAISSMFMNDTLEAPVHLVMDRDQNLTFAKNHFWISLKKINQGN